MDFILLVAAPALFPSVFKGVEGWGGGGGDGGKNLKDRPRWFIVGMFVFVHQGFVFITFIFSPCLPPTKSSVCH